MTIILDDKVSRTGTAKMIELNDEYIINGHLYDKSSFGPKPLRFLPHVANDAPMLMNSIMQLTGSNPPYAQSSSTGLMMVDINDPDITYILEFSSTLTNRKLIKFNTRDGIDRVEDSTFGSVVNSEQYELTFMDQDDDYLYILATGHYCYVYKVDKMSLVFETGLGIGGTRYRGRARHLFSDDGHIYISVINQSETIIQKYNKQLNSINTINETSLYEDSTGTGIHDEGTISKFTRTSDTEGYGFHIFENKYNYLDAPGEVNIYRYEYSGDNHVMDISKLEMDFSGVDIELNDLSIRIINDSYPNQYSRRYHSILVNDNDQDYLTILTLEGTNVTSGNLPKPEYARIYTFRVDHEEDKLVCTHVEDLNQIFFKQMLEIYNGETLVLANDNLYAMYKWNTGIKGYTMGSIKSSNVKSISIDSNNNIFLMDTNTNVDMMSNVIPSDISVSYEKPEYSFSGKDVHSHLEVRALNYQGEFIATSLEIRIIGPAVFSENERKIINVSTSNKTVTKIPIKVVNQGRLSTNVKVL